MSLFFQKKYQYKQNELDLDLFDSKKSNIIEKNNYVIFNGQKYKKRIWQNKVLEGLNFKNPSNSHLTNKLGLTFIEIKHFFLENVKKSLFLANFLPAILFFSFFLISFRLRKIIEENGNFGVEQEIHNVNGIIWLLAIIFLVLSLCLLIQVFILNYKVVYRKKGQRYGYLVLSNQKYNQILSYLNEHIKKEYISFIPIRSKRLIIREIKEQDSNDYYEMATNVHVNKYLMGKSSYSQEEIKDIINNLQEKYQNKVYHKLGICLNTNNKLIGYIGLSSYDLTLRTCQVVYALNEAYWHQGFASEALKSFIPYLIVEQKKEIIYAGHVKENENSGKVLLKCGFRREISRDSSLVIHGEVKEITGYIYKKEEK